MPGSQCGWDQRPSARRVNDFPDTLSSCWGTCMANSQTTAYHRPCQGLYTQFRQNSDFEASRLQGLSWLNHTFCQVALGYRQQEACNFTQQSNGHVWPNGSPLAHLPSTVREVLGGRLGLSVISPVSTRVPGTEDELSIDVLDKQRYTFWWRSWAAIIAF